MVVRDIDSIWLFLQVESKKYCSGVRVPRLSETRFICVFNEWVRFFYDFFEFFYEFIVFKIDSFFSLI